jgi:predicted aspartyl protease
MGLITKELTVIGPKGRQRLTALFDTGASFSLIRNTIAEPIGDPAEIPEPKKFTTAVGEFRAHTYIVVDIALERKRLFPPLIVGPGLTEDLILGADFLQQWHIRLDPKRHRFLLDPKALKLRAVGSRYRPR